MFLDMQRIQLIEGDVWGHRKDINEYYNIPSSVIEKIKAMKNEGKSTEDIEAKVSRESKLNPDMVAYILNKEVHA
jgi:ribosomal protein S19